MKNNLLRFIFSVFAGALGVGFLGLIAFISFKLGNRVIDFLDIENKKPKVNYSALKHDFSVDFEKKEDGSIFESSTSAFIISDKFHTSGKQSLLVEYPSGREFPGIFLDVYGKDCFDWSDMDEFSFDVFNANSLPVMLTVKMKSGKDYPKKEFETSQNIPPQSIARFKIKRGELESALDLDKISYLNFYVRDPATTFFLYFDNIKVVKRK